MAATGRLGYGPNMSQSSELAAASVRIAVVSGAVTVSAEPDLHSVVTNGLPIDVDGSTVTLGGRSERVRLRVPEDIDLMIGTTSGRVVVRGRVGSVAVVTVSGGVEIDDAASVDVRTTSGRVRVARSRGGARVVSVSGRVEIEGSGAVDVTTRSGRIVLRNVSGTARAHCASGKIEVVMAEAHDVDAETISGRISVSLPAGTRPRIDTPSTGVISPTGEHDCVIVARSGSGRVDVSTR